MLFFMWSNAAVEMKTQHIKLVWLIHCTTYLSRKMKILHKPLPWQRNIHTHACMYLECRRHQKQHTIAKISQNMMISFLFQFTIVDDMRVAIHSICHMHAVNGTATVYVCVCVWANENANKIKTMQVNERTVGSLLGKKSQIDNDDKTCLHSSSERKQLYQ